MGVIVPMWGELLQDLLYMVDVGVLVAGYRELFSCCIQSVKQRRLQTVVGHYKQSSNHIMDTGGTAD